MKIAFSLVKVYRSALTVILSVASSAVFAQNPSGFSGTWVLDHTKSSAELKDYQIICNIKETAQTMSVEQIFQTMDGKQTSMQPILYNLDGKEVSKEEEGGTDRIIAKWSSDKKTLTTKFVRTMSGFDYGSITTYSISADGKVLTVKSSDLKGETPMVQVYLKK
ncbi:MAG TPA: hypothetical protein VK212_08005 [Lentimicrobium sp.]|nr:hypothetical protein [Lentimicrobium sp.]